MDHIDKVLDAAEGKILFFTFDLRSSLLTLGNRKARFPLLSLNRSLHYSLFT